MDIKYQEVFQQYNFKIYNTFRVRGAHIVETNKGPKLFKRLECSKNRIDLEDKIQQFLVEKCHPYVDLYVPNVNKEVITKDSMGNCFILKDWYSGTECNLRDEVEVLYGVRNLTLLHNILKEFPMDPQEVCFNLDLDLREAFEKRNRELRRVRSYIRGKRKKNEFELCFLACYEHLFKQALLATKLLKESGYDRLKENSINKRHICHGNYTYHNVLLLNERQNRNINERYGDFKSSNIITTNFDRSVVGIQINDLYHFIRKTMEKNDWNIELGNKMIQTYDSHCNMTKDEKDLLYILLLYPEKFWKISNYYFNGKKTWVPRRTIQKLMDVKNQTMKKDKFIKQLKK